MSPPSISETLQSLSHGPGVYIYKNEEKIIIYIGKAIDLSRRVKQYFQRDDAVGDKTPRLVSEITTIDTIETENEFDALLLEAKLIKFYQPKFKKPFVYRSFIEGTITTCFFREKTKERNSSPV